MTRATFWCASLCMLAACTSDIDARGASIAGGTLEPGEPEVVYLYRIDGASCTASIISPRVVLTANHCVVTESGTPAPAYMFRIYVGGSWRTRTAEYTVSEVRQVPGAGFGGGTEPNDVALLVLSGAAAETPLEIARQSPSTLVNNPVTAIGYGQTPSGSAGTKYATTTSVTAYTGGFIFVDPSVCSGDSGGPLIGSDGLVYGVASFIYSPDGTTEPHCGTAPGAYNEIYRHIEFIDSVLEETGTCVPEAEVCNGEDDNCDGVVDEGCRALGETCTDSSECVGGLCADTRAGRVCTTACDALRPELGCGAGFYCAGGGSCDGYCLRGTAGTIAHGAACTADTECASLLCTDPGDGNRRCLDPCRGDAGLCLAGEVCVAAPGACGACVAKEIVVADRGLGEPCATDAECRDGLTCFAHGGISECASACTGECVEGFECRENKCIRDRRQGVGGVCVDNGDCGATGVCATQAERSWCTAACTTRSNCPTDFDCVAAGGTHVCAPIEALVGEPCTANADCVSDLCVTLPSTAQICTAFCDARTPCAPGFECRRTGTADPICVPPASAFVGRTGCSATASPVEEPRGSALFTLLLVGVALVLRRRARR